MYKEASESKSYYDNGNLAMHHTYHARKTAEDPVIDELRKYYGSGSLHEHAFFYNDQYHGIRTIYNPDGQVHARETYIYGHKVERKTYYPQSGNIQSVSHYQYGWFASGIYKNWDENGSLLYYLYYIPNVNTGKPEVVVRLTLEITMSLLYFKNRLRKRVIPRLRKLYLDNYILSDLGDIIMLYYIKSS
jgi:antitoxin component YwqK of YwqJK toxin-antitoxin module